MMEMKKPESTESGLCRQYLQAAKTWICVTENETAMGQAAQGVVRDRAKKASDEGKHVVFWVMAAPSGFAWYDAFIRDCEQDAEFAEIVGRSEFFQFDDYPIGRNDRRFPVTFRNLLEQRLYGRLGAAAPSADHIHRLELDGTAADDVLLRRYGESLFKLLDDPGVHVIEVKGIGMDGHWGFHGRETPLDHPAEMFWVPINRQNRIQQTLDWPEYFPDVEAVPDSAATAAVGMFLKAQTIVDLVPQRSKLFSVLAAYGTDEVLGDIPSSALKGHNDSHSFLTEAAAEALVEFRSKGSLSAATREALDGIWKDDGESREWARSVLEKGRMVVP